MTTLAAILALTGRVLWALLRGRRPRLDRGMAGEVRQARHTGAHGSARDINQRLADLERRQQAARNAR